MTSNQWKKQIAFLLCLLLVPLFAACSSFSKSKYGKKVVNNIKQHDSDAMFEMFAPVYQEETSFKADLFEFLDAVYGLELDFENAVRRDGAYSKNYDNGKLSYYDCTFSYDEVVDSSGRQYSLVFSLTQTDIERPENVGLQCLGLMICDNNDSEQLVTFIGRDNSSDSMYCYDVLDLES